MNSIKCPQCGLVNWGTPPACKRCGASFEGVTAQDFVSIPAGEQTYEPGFPVIDQSAQETEETRKTWRWYVIYCGLMALLYLSLMGVGAILLMLDPGPGSMGGRYDEMKAQAVGCLIGGLVFFLPYALGPFVKTKRWGWTFGTVLIAIGMTSCCLWPITIPLLIRWIKPEMKRVFGQS
ncbi:MAG TPA: hypothetical protein VM911_16645 [Pyrinomonadaceae bacterium]|jgi:hypothetical protein|nr:hypothetical protein [Pyrinomonadaceae bacterium]